MHRRDARAKLLATLLLLLGISQGGQLPSAVLAAAGLALAQLPLSGVLVRACIVLPFSGGLAIATLLSGRADLAVALLVRSYLSAVCVLLLTGTTPLPALLKGLERLGAPGILLEVIQFVYRYLSLAAGQVKRMSDAAAARGARRSLPAIAGSAGVLFARSYARAEAVHSAMLARGYSGSMPRYGPGRFGVGDVMLVSAALLAFIASLL